MERVQFHNPIGMVEEQIARLQVAIELNRIPKLEGILEAQRAHIASLEKELYLLKTKLSKW